MIRRPPTSRSAFGCPPMRVLLPPAWITPTTFTPGPPPSSPRRPARSFEGDRALAEQTRRIDTDVEYGRGCASARRASVQDEIDKTVEIPQHLLGRPRRRGLTGIG